MDTELVRCPKTCLDSKCAHMHPHVRIKSCDLCCDFSDRRQSCEPYKPEPKPDEGIEPLCKHCGRPEKSHYDSGFCASGYFRQQIEKFEPVSPVTAPKLVSVESVTMSEAQLQDAIIELAHALGYRVAHFRPAQTSKGWRTPVGADGKGFPDLVLAKPDKEVIFIECKSTKGKTSPEQEDWWRALMPNYYLFRPADYLNDTITEVLR